MTLLSQLLKTLKRRTEYIDIRSQEYAEAERAVYLKEKGDANARTTVD